jgi:hypothetical protein
MVIIVNGIRQGITWSNFAFCAKTPEAGFDQLSTYVADGLILQNVRLIDGVDQMELPPEVFDGQLFGPPIRHLKQQWEHILQNLPVAENHQQRFKAWNSQLVIFYEKQIGQFSTAIERMEKIALKNAARQLSPKSIRLARQYDAVLHWQENQLTAIRLAHQKAVDHMRQFDL